MTVGGVDDHISCIRRVQLYFMGRLTALITMQVYKRWLIRQHNETVNRVFTLKSLCRRLTSNLRSRRLLLAIAQPSNSHQLFRISLRVLRDCSWACLCNSTWYSISHTILVTSYNITPFFWRGYYIPVMSRWSLHDTVHLCTGYRVQRARTSHL